MIVVFTLILSTIFIAFIISCCQKLFRDHKIIRVSIQGRAGDYNYSEHDGGNNSAGVAAEEAETDRPTHTLYFEAMKYSHKFAQEAGERENFTCAHPHLAVWDAMRVLP